MRARARTPPGLRPLWAGAPRGHGEWKVRRATHRVRYKARMRRGPARAPPPFLGRLRRPVYRNGPPPAAGEGCARRGSAPSGPRPPSSRPREAHFSPLRPRSAASPPSHHVPPSGGGRRTSPYERPRRVGSPPGDTHSGARPACRKPARCGGPSHAPSEGYLVDPASNICLSQRLSHAGLSTHGRYSETANGSLNQLWSL